MASTAIASSSIIASSLSHNATFSSATRASTSAQSTVASTSTSIAHSAPPSGTRVFSPPRWIFSYNPSDDDRVGPSDDLTAVALSSNPPRALAQQPGQWVDSKDEQFPAYGPKRGAIRFVKATLGQESSTADEVRPTKAAEETVSKGSQIRELYESLVGLGGTSPALGKLDKGKRKGNEDEDEDVRSVPTKTPDVDLTLDDDDDEPEAEAEEEEIIIIDPFIHLPVPPPRLHKRPRLRPISRAIHELLPSSAPSRGTSGSIEPMVPPIHYGIPSSNIGWKILARQGWKEGSGLGPEVRARSEDRTGLKVPLKASDKFDRKGLGPRSENGNKKMSKEDKERDRKRRELNEVEKRGKGSLGMERKRQKEEKERRELLGYMNRP